MPMAKQNRKGEVRVLSESGRCNVQTASVRLGRVENSMIGRFGGRLNAWMSD